MNRASADHAAYAHTAADVVPGLELDFITPPATYTFKNDLDGEDDYAVSMSFVQTLAK